MNHTFPKWFYHKTHMPEGQIIQNQEQLDGLGLGWVESPADFESDETTEKKATKQVEEIKKIVIEKPPLKRVSQKVTK